MKHDAAEVGPGEPELEPSQDAPQDDSGNGGMLRALRHRNFRLFITGTIISNIGGWLAGVARGYFVYQLTGSKALLGTVAFASTIPALLLGPLAGIVTDRYYRKPIIVTTQATFVLTNAVLAWLIFTGQVLVWHMIALSLIEGVAAAFNGPVYQSLTVEFVGPKDLMNAIALNSLQFNISRVVGSLAGGLIYAWLGPAWSFTLNSISFLAVIAALLAIPIRRPHAKAVTGTAYSSFRQGMGYMRRHKDLMAIVSLAATVTVFSLPYMTLLPVYARDILRGGAKMQAYLLAAVGVGALAAGLRQAMRLDDAGKGRRMLWSCVSLGVCIAVFAKATFLPLSLLALIGTGAAMVSMMTTANTTMQLLIPDELRGRLMSVYVMASFGLSPIGSLLMGVMAQYMGAPNAVLAGALISLAGTVGVAVAFPVIHKL